MLESDASTLSSSLKPPAVLFDGALESAVLKESERDSSILHMTTLTLMTQSWTVRTLSMLHIWQRAPEGDMMMQNLKPPNKESFHVLNVMEELIPAGVVMKGKAHLKSTENTKK
ncbi:hypothetical protein Pcinc_010780 [Petrolisthes cinctipes]|uniref:Uncharacterized protein n=1 Tax=Petrolisthes cinctipes TaxID=88211 RepID=A0AAE1G2C0_PETCI|nr:hypothetical protein Pcinc_010780 [Petrolisthes cinctipes]